MPYLLIGLAVAARLLPHPPNVTPVAAVALFGGVFLNKKAAFTLPLAVMALSDFFLGFHSTIPFVYASLILGGAIGIWLQAHWKPSALLAATFINSVIFFIVTNFGVWMTAGLYPHNPQGLIACYTAAIPFFRNTLIGDTFFTGVLFGLQALAIRYKLSAAASA